MANLNCLKLNDFFIRKAEHWSREAYDKISPCSPWIKWIPKMEFPSGSGTTIKIPTFGRVRAPQHKPWTPIVMENGCPLTDACNPPRQVICFGSSDREARLVRGDTLSTQTFCFLNVYTADYIEQTVQNMIEQMADVQIQYWAQEYEYEYLVFVENKVVASEDMNPGIWTFNANGTITVTELPTSSLTLKMLYYWVDRLQLEGAWKSCEGTVPLMQVITDNNTVYDIQMGNNQLVDVMKYADPKEIALYKGLGGYKKLGNFVFLNNPTPRRFQVDPLAPLVLIEVLPFIPDPDITRGCGTIPNPQWFKAPYQISYIFNKDVVHSAIPASSVSGMKFGAQDFMGKFTWKNIPDAECNEFQNKGFWSAQAVHAPYPIHPEYGVAFLHRRCDVKVDALDCCDIPAFVPNPAPCTCVCEEVII